MTSQLGLPLCETARKKKKKKKGKKNGEKGGFGFWVGCQTHDAGRHTHLGKHISAHLFAILTMLKTRPTLVLATIALAIVSSCYGQETPPHLSQAWQAMSTGDGLPKEIGKDLTYTRAAKKEQIHA